MRILNFGSLCIDNVYQVPHFVRPGETLPSLGHRIFAGGKGFNQSLAIARAGIPVAHAGMIGAEGRWLIDMLDREGIDTRGIEEADLPTGHAMIQVTPAGENAIVLLPGANRCVTREQVDRVLADYGQDDILLLQNEISELSYLIERGHALGMQIVLNPAPMDTAISALPLDLVDLLIVNEVEAQDLTGAAGVDEMLAALAARLPTTRKVLTLGAAGAIWQDGNLRHRVPADPVDVVDTTAAGDTFTGYLLAALVRQSDPLEAMREATRAAAWCVGRAGAADSIPRRAELDG